MVRFDCIERPLAKLFHRYGVYITKNPIPFIVFPVLATLALSTSILSLDPLTDAIYLFTPSNAPSKMERQAVHDLWPTFNGTYIPGRAVTQSREVQASHFWLFGLNLGFYLTIQESVGCRRGLLKETDMLERRLPFGIRRFLSPCFLVLLLRVFFQANDSLFQITVLAKDAGNVLDKPYSEAVYRLDLFIQNRIIVTHEGRNYTYKDLCISGKTKTCPGNKHVFLLSDLFQKGINISYPTVRLGTV